MQAESQAVRERAKRWDYLRPEPEAMCQRCGGPLYPDAPGKSSWSMGNPFWTHRRKYCCSSAGNTARRFRYRVAGLSEDSRYRVTGNRYALSEPVPCWRSEEWHLLAKVAIGLMEQGWVLTRELDFLEVERVTLADVREAVRPGPSQEA